MIRSIALMFAVTLMASCGITPRPVCDAQTCSNGCCDADGECQSGLEATACGHSGGGACSVCFLGQICSAGFCLASNSGGGSGGGGVTGGGSGGGAVTGGGSGGGAIGGGGGAVTGGGTGGSGGGGSSSCSSSNCAGCCDSTGFCQLGTGDFTCGAAGASCLDCTSQGRSCSMGLCVAGGGTGGGGAVTGGGTGGGAVTGGGAGGGAVTGGGAGGGAVTGGGGGMTGGGTGGCGPAVPGNPTIQRRCANATANECDTTTDLFLATAGVPSTRANGIRGNGFDDDCDGLVDEGCACPANGATKECNLVPATQVGSNGLPVGWCSENSHGSLDCAGGAAPTWSGVCRGALPPATSDTCATGDFNCDGLNANNAVQGCSCPTVVQCPSGTMTLAPYPSTTALPLVDGSSWIVDSAARARAIDWSWTVLGGDCDNVLPNPTFAIYSSAISTTSGARKGTRTAVVLDATQTPARYVPSGGAPLIAIRASAYGVGVAGGQMYPAFALSGDYVVQGEFSLDGQTYACTQKVQVRAPGIRAELCWDTVGGSSASTGNDLDLHFARLQGTTCTTHGWNMTCMNTNGSVEDCHWSGSSGCANTSPGPNWGYTDSATTACHGWSSTRTAVCTNPRLDRDNIRCDRAMADPTNTTFCGPENINLDVPANNDAFVVGVNHYGNNSGTVSAKPHVNLYCNGTRVLSAGFNPATGQSQFPLLNTAGADTNGDFWTVAAIRASVAAGNLSCTVTPVPSRTANAIRDGAGNPGNGICVDHAYASKNFVETGTGQGLTMGSLPTMPAQFCKH